MTNQSDRQASVRTATGTAGTYESDWHALFDQASIAAGSFNGRLLAWINAYLGTSYTEVNGAMQAFATNAGVYDWNSLGTFNASAYDPAAVTLFAAMNVQPSSARKTLYNNLIVSLKSAGIWTKLDVLYILAAHDEQASRLNIVSPSTFTAQPINAPTFVADRGWTGDGSSSRLRTQFIPSTNGVNIVLNDASIWLWSRTAAANVNYPIGNISVNPKFGLRFSSATYSMTLNSTTITTVGSAVTALGFLGTSRASSTIQKFWFNGAQFGADSSNTSTGVSSNEQWLLGANSTSFNDYQQAAGAWGASLTGLESSFYTTLQTYLQAVGAA